LLEPTGPGRKVGADGQLQTGVMPLLNPLLPLAGAAHILADRYLTTPADGDDHDAESEQDDPRDEQNQPSGIEIKPGSVRERDGILEDGADYRNDDSRADEACACCPVHSYWSFCAVWCACWIIIHHKRLNASRWASMSLVTAMSWGAGAVGVP